MPLKQALIELIENVPGAWGAILLDWEGEAVEQVVAGMDDYELKVLGAHKGVILSNLREIVARLGNDTLEEIVVTTDQSQTLVLPVTTDYFLVFTFSHGELLGRAQFAARRCAVRLRVEIL